MKNLILLFGCFFLLACSDDADEMINDDSIDDNPVASELPKTFVMIKSETYYLTQQTVLPDPNAYRVQLNFAPEADFTKTNNDGTIPSVFSIVVSTLEKQTQSGELTFTDQRFLTGLDGKVNLYQSFFFNTGSEFEGDNFLSPVTGSIVYTLADAQLVADLSTIVMTNEADASQSFEMTGHFEIAY